MPQTARAATPDRDPATTTAQSPEPRTVALTPAEYWQLRAAIRDVEALELQFVVAREDFGRRIREATERREKLFAEVVCKYELPAVAKYRCDDATCSLHQD